jgi:hypothetical protein
MDATMKFIFEEQEHTRSEVILAERCVMKWRDPEKPPASLTNAGAIAIVSSSLIDQQLRDELVEDDVARRAILSACDWR